jgi:PAS domain S-box-containing protein
MTACAALGTVALPAFLTFDLVVLRMPMLLPWRIIGLAPFPIALLLSLTLLAKRDRLVVPIHAFTLLCSVIMMCGIVGTTFLHGEMTHSDMHNASTGLSVVVFIVFVFSAGTRRYLPFILLIPIGVTCVAIFDAARVDLKDYSMLINPVVEAVFVSAYAAVHERWRKREFAVREDNAAKERLLESQHAVMSTILESIHESALLVKADGSIVYANSTVGRRFGLATEDLRGKNVFELLPSDLAAERKGRFLEAIGRGEAVRFQDERLGREIDNTVYPIKDSDGVVRTLVLVGIDITERVNALRKTEKLLEQKTVLLKEVHHRIKNHLAMLSSLLSLQAESESASAHAGLRAATSRVQAMARIYETLNSSERYASIGLPTYLGALVADIAQTYRGGMDVRLETSFEEIQVTPNFAFNVGMVVNELVTNALKYAFPDGRGSILVSASGIEGGRLAISVKDDGIGCEGPGCGAEGFGLRLVDMIADQFNGSVRRYGPPGTAIVVELELPERR